MNERSIQHVTEQRGIVLILSLFVMTILSILGLAFLVTARTEDTIASNYRNHTAAFYVAEAGLESGVATLKSLLGTSPTPTDAQLTALAAPALTDTNYTFDAFQVGRIRPTPYSTTIASGPYAGLVAQTTNYQITAQVSGPRASRARLNQVVQHLQIPLFQFGAFYGRGVDLEIAPGPPMTFNGRVHANSNIYIRNSSMKFDSFVTTVGNIYRYLKRDPSTRGSNPQIKDASGTYQTLNFDHEYNQDFSNPWSVDEWMSTALSTFGGKLQDSAMGVQEIIPPIPEAFYDPNNPDVSSHQMIEKGDAADTAELKTAKMYYEADLRIEDSAATDNSGNPVNLTALGCDPSTITTQTFYDKREQANMTVTQVDVGKLKDCGQAPANGILYVHHDGLEKAVRLVNGSELPSQGFTVVSENPIYIQGDYNTVNKTAAAVLADAITILSNNWGPNDSDTKGDQVTSNRPATNTTVNAAFALGPSAESDVGQGNGQLENVIRFLEKWSGKDFNYNGSIIALWHSQEATAPWRCCGDSGTNYYNPPNRNWAYDPLFDTNPPPGTPMGIVVMRGQWSQG